MAGLVREALEIHFLVIGAHFFPMADLAFTCQQLFGWEEKDWLPLLAGRSPASTEPALALESLADMAKRQPPVLQGILEREPLAAVVTDAPEFSAAFGRYLEPCRFPRCCWTCGHRRSSVRGTCRLARGR